MIYYNYPWSEPFSIYAGGKIIGTVKTDYNRGVWIAGLVNSKTNSLFFSGDNHTREDAIKETEEMVLDTFRFSRRCERFYVENNPSSEVPQISIKRNINKGGNN